MANTQTSAQEQLLIELVNRARLDPTGEASRYGVDLNAGLSPGTISTAPKAPLAPNADLSEAAANHSQWMLDADTFSHTGAGGSTPQARMAGAGYSFSGAWGAGENISWRGSTGSIDQSSSILEHHKSLFLSAGHRVNILGDYREMGVGQEVGGFTASNGTTYNASMVTEDFARAGTRAFITGVAYSDADGDRFYDIGEGRGGVTFDRLDDSSGAVSTQAAGGYALGLPTGLSGSTTVAVSSGGTTREVSLAMTGGNVKLDLVGTTLASSTSMALGARAQDGLLLGAASLQLTGNGLDNHLTGNRASNLISGAGGNDVISGGNGNDRLLGGDGADRIEGGTGTDTFTGGAGSDNFVFTVKSGAPTGSDTITDLQSGDRITVDLPSLPGSSSAWEDGHISSVSGGVQIALDDGSRILVSNTISHSLVHDALVLV